MIPRLFLLILIGLLSHIPVAHAKRVALLIGNAGYVSEKTLANPVRDARLLARVLKDDLKFDDVKLVENADRARLIELIDQFQRQAAGAEAAVFYFSGHGMQDGGKRNYLIPVDARIQGEAGIRAYGVQADEVVAALASAAPRVSVVILDACRDNPYASAVKSGTKGLARMEVNTDQELLIAYATRDGHVAQDGRGNNSPYATSLARHLKQAGQKPLLSLFDQVADQVRAETRNQQRPTRYGDLKASTYLLESLAPEPVTPPRPTPIIATPSLAPAEAAYWAEVKKSDNADYYAAYLANYPNGRYIAAANEYIERDKQAKAAKENLKEDHAWQKAQSGESFASFSAYLKSYPSGRYAKLAELKLKKLLGAARDCPECPEMVQIPAGSFQMGSNVGDTDEKPVRRVSLNVFAMSKTEITNQQFRQFRPGHRSGDYEGQSLDEDDQPVVNVSWEDVQAYLQWLSSKTGQPYRLPSEAEWEYANRAGTNSIWIWGNDENASCQYANIVDQTAKAQKSDWTTADCTDGFFVTAPVGTFRANAFGLHDMTGNVWEWVEDCYYSSYSGAPSDGSAWASGSCDNRGLRGGSWSSVTGDSRATNRSGDKPAGRGGSLGFRVVRAARTF